MNSVVDSLPVSLRALLEKRVCRDIVNLISNYAHQEPWGGPLTWNVFRWWQAEYQMDRDRWLNRNFDRVGLRGPRQDMMTFFIRLANPEDYHMCCQIPYYGCLTDRQSEIARTGYTIYRQLSRRVPRSLYQLTHYKLAKRNTEKNCFFAAIKAVVGETTASFPGNPNLTDDQLYQCVEVEGLMSGEGLVEQIAQVYVELVHASAKANKLKQYSPSELIRGFIYVIDYLPVSALSRLIHA